MPGMNTTQVGLQSLNEFGSWFPSLMLIVIGAIFIGGIIILLSISYAKYKRFMWFLDHFGAVLMYFSQGMLGTAVFGSFFYGLWYVGQLQSEGTIRLDIIGTWIMYGAAAFIGITTFGYILDKFWKRVKKFGKEYDKEQGVKSPRHSQKKSGGL